MPGKHNQRSLGFSFSPFQVTKEFFVLDLKSHLSINTELPNYIFPGVWEEDHTREGQEGVAPGESTGGTIFIENFLLDRSDGLRTPRSARKESKPTLKKKILSPQTGALQNSGE